MSFGKIPERSAGSARSRLTVVNGASRSQAAALLHALETRLGHPLHLRINNNSSTLLSVVRPRDGSPPRYSVHLMFLSAPEPVVAALAQYVKRATPSCQALLRQYMNAWTDAADQQDERDDGSAAAPAAPARPLKLSSRGLVYDLHNLAEQVNEEFFGGELRVNITWSRGAREPREGTRRRHIIFGSYEKRNALIRIHPALDSKDVPEFFVKFVIYHEMLHHVLDPLPQPGGRRCVHTPQFRDRERRHPDFKRCLEWERLFMQGKHR